MKIDLNCDLGENEPLTRTRSLMRWISSANVACGGHAGDVKSMAACVLLARQFRVNLGAHPGPWSRADHGRGSVEFSPDELELLLLQQVSSLERVARQHGLKLHHIKLHGGLYHATEQFEPLAARYIAAVKKWWPSSFVYALAGGNLVRIARRAGVKVRAEAFADRGYRDDGSLVSRGEPGALVTEANEVCARVAGMIERHQVKTVTGHLLEIHPQTICVHSDTPGAVALARRIAKEVEA